MAYIFSVLLGKILLSPKAKIKRKAENSCLKSAIICEEILWRKIFNNSYRRFLYDVLFLLYLTAFKNCLVFFKFLVKPLYNY